MRRFHFLALTVALFFGMGLAVSCGDDDDDASNDNHDNDEDDADGDDHFAELIWQELPSSDDVTWEEAIEYCENLIVDDHDDWRLPTISELRSLIRGCDTTELGGACGVMDGCRDFDCWNNPCHGCESLKGPGDGGAYWPHGLTGPLDWYWSSSAVADLEGSAWGVHFDDSLVDSPTVDHSYLARCVR